MAITTSTLAALAASSPSSGRSGCCLDICRSISTAFRVSPLPLRAVAERCRKETERTVLRKAKDYAARKTALADEQIALSDTIKLLSDERLEKAFSKTVRSVSFLDRKSVV